MRKKLLLALLLMGFGTAVGPTLYAQTIPVSGRVTSAEDNEPLPGVNIFIVGTSTGTTTDIDGNYVLDAVAGDTLAFSFIGFATEKVPVGGRNQINVAMVADIQALSEVVVVGYGTQSRETITSSVAKLDTEVLENTPRANVGSALQGTVSGLRVVNATGQPGATPSIILRGGASINNPSPPLVVVDGVIRSYSDISPNDIASIQVLKDAAATAIYGARANNGVILITTKQGRAGQARISYKFTGGYNQRRGGYDYFGARDFIYYNRLGNLHSGVPESTVDGNRRGYGISANPADVASFDIREYDASTGHLVNEGWEVMDDPYGGQIIFKDHGGEVEDLVFRNTYTKDHFINVTGGNDRGKYYASFNYYNEEGVIVGSEYKRYSANLNGSYRVKPNVAVSTGVLLSTSSQYGTVGGEINTLYRNLAIWPTFNPWLDEAKTQPNPGNGASDGNPLYWLGKREQKDEVNKVTASASVQWDILPGLYVKGTGSAYLSEDVYNYFGKATQTYPQVFADPPQLNTTRPSYAGLSREFQQQYSALANYSRTFGGRHNVEAMAGAEFFSQKNYAIQVYGTEAPTDDIPTVNAATNFVPGNNYSLRQEYAIVSAFGRLNYDFDGRFLFTAVFRQDAISKLAEDNRVGFFPGMSAGWNIHREDFFQRLKIADVVSTLKPRISYGENGNVTGVSNYEVQGAYGNIGLYNGNAGFLNTEIINQGLRWEQSRTTDAGLDLGLFNDRLNLLFDYYNRETSDLLTFLSLPNYTGFGSIRTNLGTYQNTGVEFAVNATLLDQADGLRLRVGANASFVENEILELPFNGNENNRQGGFQIYDPELGSVTWVGGLQEGGRLGDIYAFKQVGIFRDEAEVAEVAGTRVDAVADIGGPETGYGSAPGTGQITPGDVNWLDVDQNDTIDLRDQVYIGNIYPKWTGGFNANLSYKGFSLYTRFEFALGHTIYNDLVARTLGNFQGTFNYIALQEQSWTPDNRETDIPKVYYADQVSAPLGKKNYTRANGAGAVLNGNNSRFYEDGDYLACREITLSYDFAAGLLEKTGLLSNARIFATASNLFYITKFSGPTPEPPMINNDITGVYRGTYPTPRSYVLGVEVSF